MTANLRALKDQAAAASADGKHQDALELLLRVLREDAADHTTRQRVADLYRKLGRHDEAIAAYQATIGGYAAEGRLAKAIALCKLILQIDPRHVETQKTLADLYGRKTGAPIPTPLPTSMAQALQPAGPKLGAAAIRGRRARKINLPALQLGELPGAHAAAPASRPAAAPPPPAVGTPPVASAPGTALPGRGRTHSGSIEVNLDFDLLEERPATPPASVDVAAVSELDIVEEEAASSAAVAATEPAAVEVDFEIDDALEDEEAVQFDEELLAASAPPSVVVLPSPTAPPAGAQAEAPAAPTLGIDPAQLPTIPLFGDLPKNAFIDVLQKLTLRQMHAGERLVRAGEPGDTLAIIASGVVRVDKPRPEGPPIPLARLREGEFFGEMALLGDGVRTADVVAESDGELLEIDKRTLSQIAKRFPSVRAVLARFYKQHMLGQLFKTSSLFLPFDPPTRKQLYARFKQLSVPRGQAILEEGKKGDGLYVLVSGRCEVSREEAGLRLVLAELAEGDIFGEVSLLTGQPAMATVKALRKCTVLKLPRPTFRELIMTHPQILELVSTLSEQRQAVSVEAMSQPGGAEVKQWL